MAHLSAPQPPSQFLPVFFNVDRVVGAPPAQNLREDVLLVQFAFKLIGESPLPGTEPELAAAARAVRITGMVDAATINAIRVMQQSIKKTNPGQIVDGRVSPARGGYSYGSAAWIIGHLNNSINARHKDVWPRIDKIGGCPAGLVEMVKRTLVGV